MNLLPILFVTLAGDMPPKDAPEPEERVIAIEAPEPGKARCGEGLCVMHMDDFLKLRALVGAIPEVTRRLKALEESCVAKVDPKKPIFKKERST